MVPKQNPFVRWVVVLAVKHRVRGGLARIVKNHHPSRNECAVKSVADNQHAQGAYHNGKSAHIVSLNLVVDLQELEKAAVFGGKDLGVGFLDLSKQGFLCYLTVALDGDDRFKHQPSLISRIPDRL